RRPGWELGLVPVSGPGGFHPGHSDLAADAAVGRPTVGSAPVAGEDEGGPVVRRRPPRTGPLGTHDQAPGRPLAQQPQLGLPPRPPAGLAGPPGPRGGRRGAPSFRAWLCRPPATGW